VKRYIFILGLVALGVVIVTGCAQAEPTPTPTATFTAVPTPTLTSTPFVPPTEPEPGPLTTQGYVYDDKLGYGFEYPGGWELYIGEDDFPDDNIRKAVSFKKKISKDRAQYLVEIELTIKSVPDLLEVKNEFKQGLEMSGVPILSEATISIDNISGYDILSGTSTWKLRQVVFFANGMAYIFKYSSQGEFYRMYEESFDNVIGSFNIE